MSLEVRPFRSSDSEKPPSYWTSNDIGVIFQSRSTRFQNIETHYHLSPVSKSADSFLSSDDILRKINLKRSGSENSLLHGAESFDLGHVLLTLIDAAKRADTVYLDSALGAPAAPISFYAPVNTKKELTPTSQLDYSALLASLPRDELFVVAASINSSTDLSDSDSDSNSDMAGINPATFSGTASEDADNWLRHFCNFCNFKAHSPSKMLSLFKVLMFGSAATWLDSLPHDIRSDWRVLKDCFLTRYTTPEFLNYKNAHELFNSKQGTKSVDDFCASMQRIAKRVGADNRMLRFAVLNGLRPEIANFVNQKQPTDWEKLLEAARLGEMCVADQPNTDTLVTKQLTQMLD